MSAELTRIASRFIGQPLALHPAKAEVLLHVLGGRIGVDVSALPEPQANRYWGAPVGQRNADGVFEEMYRVIDGVAVISVVGVLINRGAWIGSKSGDVSYEGLDAQLTMAEAAQDVRAIVLDMETPGGEVRGVDALSKRISALNQAKPIVAYLNDMAASAGYHLAAQASQIVGTAGAVAGSVGTVLIHFDRSGEMEQKGVVPTIITSAAHKMDGHPFGPLSEGVRADLQATVDQFNEMFLQAVGAGRGAKLTPDAARALDGRTFIGQEAVARGLIDQIGSFDDAINIARSLADAHDRAQSAGGLMTQETGAPGADNPGTTPEADEATKLEQVRSEAFAAGREEGIKAGAEAERQRILGIEGIAMAGHEKLVAEMKGDGVTTPEQAALKLIQAEKESGSARALANMQAGELAAAGVGAAPPPDNPAKASTPDEWATEWKASSELQAEFPTAESYVATMKREAA